MSTASNHPDLAGIAQNARRKYVERITGGDSATLWWTAVIVTASSARQAERYETQIRQRRQEGKVPDGVLYLVVPDLDDVRIGSGGATLNALRALVENALTGSSEPSLEAWWRRQRVLVIHSGGDSRRLPEYSLSGKLFSALPIKTPWGDVSTVFDETLALATDWVEQLPCGLVVASGDVILTFDARQLDWSRDGVCGVAMREAVEVGGRHGVYVLGDEGRVYSFLQKPSAAEVKAAGGLLPGGKVALDIGLLRFDAPTAARLTELAGARRDGERWRLGSGVLGQGPSDRPVIDLYEHMTLALTGEWQPKDFSDPALIAVSGALRNVPFSCSLVDGDFTHVGTTSHFRRLMTEDSKFSSLYTVQQRLGAVSPPGVHSAGVIVDSVFAAGGEIGAGALVIECDFQAPVRCGGGAILHGITGVSSPINVPDDVVVHQAPVRLPDGRRGTVMRVYGVQDDPKVKASAGEGTWFGRPLMETFEALGIEQELVWPGVPVSERCLWNAELFVFAPPGEAWDCACWLLGLDAEYSAEKWRVAERLSLASSAQWADGGALADARGRRQQANWQVTAVGLAESGADIRPLLAGAPGVTALRETGRRLEHLGEELEGENWTEAASRHYQAGMFLAQAGLESEATAARTAAFRCVQRAVDAGISTGPSFRPAPWKWQRVRVAAPARVDFGGGWSDTPPFCLDWGGSVLNMALSIKGQYPIATEVRRIAEPLIRCVPEGDGEATILRTAEEIVGPLAPGSSVAIPKAALRLLGVVNEGERLEERLRSLGGGLEIRTEVDLPMGSGLGTSSILGATVIRALAGMAGLAIDDLALSDQVMRLEQLMTTGGGWQDQAGGIFPGAKLVTTGPGLRQRLRVQPVAWTAERREEFAERFVLYYTGIRRIAKDLLAQVVGSYLAREVATLQVLHSIKTLAVEMNYALTQGEWDYFGRLVDRHWRLNQILDPHTTNAPIDALRGRIAPHLAGAKLAGAGGGGFLMLIAKSPEEAFRLRDELERTPDGGGTVYEYGVAGSGLTVERE